MTLLEYTRGSYAVPLLVRLVLWFFSWPLRLILGFVASRVSPWELYTHAEQTEPFLREGRAKVLGIPFRYRVIEYPATGGPYLLRLYVFKKWRERLPGLFLHYFYRSDADRDLHNHPWDWAVSLILRGGYYEHTGWDIDEYPPGSTNMLLSNSFHRVELLDERAGCWSLFVAGPREKRLWGFSNEETGEFVPAKVYHARSAELAAVRKVQPGRLRDAPLPTFPVEPDEPFNHCDGFPGCALNGRDHHDPNCCALQ